MLNTSREISFWSSAFLWIEETEGQAKHTNDEFSAFLTHMLSDYCGCLYLSPASSSCDQAAVSMKTSSPVKSVGTSLDGFLQEEAAANAHSGQPSNQNQHPAAASLEDNATPDVELGEVDNATPGAELGEAPELERKRPASAGVKVGRSP
jgi:hypothetical protein